MGANPDMWHAVSSPLLAARLNVSQSIVGRSPVRRAHIRARTACVGFRGSEKNWHLSAHTVSTLDLKVLANLIK